MQLLEDLIFMFMLPCEKRNNKLKHKSFNEKLILQCVRNLLTNTREKSNPHVYHPTQKASRKQLKKHLKTKARL